jgi:hypothetical protein
MKGSLGADRRDEPGAGLDLGDDRQLRVHLVELALKASVRPAELPWTERSNYIIRRKT